MEKYLVLDEGVEKLYEDCRSIARERLERLGMHSSFLDKLTFSDLKRLNEASNNEKLGAEDAELNRELRRMKKELNRRFAENNKLPERISNIPELREFLSSYIEKRAGRKFEVEIDKSKNVSSWVLGDYMGFGEGMRIIEFPSSVEHELQHAEEPWINITKQYSVGRMHRLSFKLREARAALRELRLVKSEDDALAAHTAIDMMLRLTESSPQSLVDRGLYSRNKNIRSYARAAEGFRQYYCLQQEVGEKLLEEFNRKCAEAGFVPGMWKDGSLFLIDPRMNEIFKVDMEKLKAGITDIEKLKMQETPLFPNPMG
jgi:hypothetical protein